MVDETPNTRLSPASDLDVKVQEFANGRVWVVVSALWWCGLSKHVSKKRSVTLLLLGHEAQKGHILGGKTGSSEVLLGKGRKTVVEQVELDPLLVKAKGDGC